MEFSALHDVALTYAHQLDCTLRTWLGNPQASGRAYVLAANNGDLSMLTALRRLGCPWDRCVQQLAADATRRACVPVLAWLQQQQEELLRQRGYLMRFPVEWARVWAEAARRARAMGDPALVEAAQQQLRRQQEQQGQQGQGQGRCGAESGAGVAGLVGSVRWA